MMPRDVGSADEHWSVFPLQVLALAGTNVAIGWLVQQLAVYQENATLVWPPTGICLAALILWGRRLWVGAWLGSFALNVITGMPLPVALGFATGNALMPLAGAFMLVHMLDFRPALERMRDVVVLLLFGGALASMISAAAGVAALWLHGNVPTEKIATVFAYWWRGDFCGVLAVTPLLLLSFLREDSVWRHLFRDRGFWIAAGICLVLLILAYSGIIPPEQERIALRLLFPLLFGVAYRLGMEGAAFFNAVVLLVANVAMAAGLGPTAVAHYYANTGLLWMFLITTGCSSLLFAAVVGQHSRAERESRSSLVERSRIEREQMVTRERDRIMREMHDGIGGQLTSILSMVERGSASKDEVSEALRRTLDDMRIMIDSYETSNSRFPEMLGRLRARLESVLRRNGLRTSWTIEPLAVLDDFDPQQSLHALRIIQEAVANVVQHAEASEIEVRIHAVDADVRTIAIEITDNGVGEKGRSPMGGHGTRNMKSRAEAIGAELRFEVGDAGRSVVLLIPVATSG